VGRGRNRRDGQKKIGKANERKGKVKRGKDEEVNGQEGRGVPQYCKCMAQLHFFAAGKITTVL